MNTWFLLFQGSSPDGRGQADFFRRTTDKTEAYEHYKKCRNDPYSNGYVSIATDKMYVIACSQTNWEAL